MCYFKISLYSLPSMSYQNNTMGSSWIDLKRVSPYVFTSLQPIINNYQQKAWDRLMVSNPVFIGVFPDNNIHPISSSVNWNTNLIKLVNFATGFPTWLLFESVPSIIRCIPHVTSLVLMCLMALTFPCSNIVCNP